MKQGQIEETERLDFRLREGVYLGALMSPAEVARAVAGRSKSLQKAACRWTLCGDVEPTIFSALQASGHPQQKNERMTVLASSSGLGHAVFTHQAGALQHRFVVPLYEAKVVNCVRAIAHGDSFGYSLGGEGSHAAIWATDFSAAEFMPLLPFCRAEPLGQEERVLQEYVATVLELRDPERIPSSLDGVAVRFASVTAIAPDEVIAKVAASKGILR